MPAKALLEIDVKIARLREQMAAGKATLETGVELDNLLQERIDLLTRLAAQEGKRPSVSDLTPARQLSPV